MITQQVIFLFSPSPVNEVYRLSSLIYRLAPAVGDLQPGGAQPGGLKSGDTGRSGARAGPFVGPVSLGIRTWTVFIRQQHTQKQRAEDVAGSQAPMHCILFCFFVFLYKSLILQMNLNVQKVYPHLD